MAPEITWMAASGVLTALMFVPYILGFIGKVGLVAALTQRPFNDVTETPWLKRAQAAHANMVENFVVFAPLAIGVAVTESGTALTASAAAAYFWLRLAHYVVYAMGVPVVRTLLFAGGVICQLILGARLLGLL